MQEGRRDIEKALHLVMTHDAVRSVQKESRGSQALTLYQKLWVLAC